MIINLWKDGIIMGYAFFGIWFVLGIAGVMFGLRKTIDENKAWGFIPLCFGFAIAVLSCINFLDLLA